MKRREFFTVTAGVGAASLLSSTVSCALADEKAAEKRGQMYRCKKCGSLVMVLVAGPASLVHCGQPMQLLVEKDHDKGMEKHVPVVEKVEGGYRVKVGSIPHPMQEEHWIECIELIADGTSHLRFLDPGDKPEATFLVTAKNVSARAVCNLHGLWKSK